MDHLNTSGRVNLFYTLNIISISHILFYLLPKHTVRSWIFVLQEHSQYDIHTKLYQL